MWHVSRRGSTADHGGLTMVAFAHATPAKSLPFILRGHTEPFLVAADGTNNRGDVCELRLRGDSRAAVNGRDADGSMTSVNAAGP